MTETTKLSSISRLLLALLVPTLLAPSFARAGLLPLQNGTATCSQNINGVFSVDDAADGTVDNAVGWAIFCNGGTQAETAVFETASNFAGESLLIFGFFQFFQDAQHTLGRFRLSAT